MSNIKKEIEDKMSNNFCNFSKKFNLSNLDAKT